MNMNQKNVKKNVSSVLSALALAAVLGNAFDADSNALLFAQSRAATTRATSRNDRETKIAERYWKILLNTPSFGAAFDQVYRNAVQKDDCASLIAELQADCKREKGETQGKRYYLLGLFYLRQNKLVEGVEALTEAETRLRDRGAVSLMLGKALILQGRLQEGAAALEHALEKELNDKELVETLEKLGDAYTRLEEREKAENVWNDAIERFGANPEVLCSIANLQADAGLYRQAGELYAKLELDASQRKDVRAEIEFAVACGDMKTRLGEKDAAIADFERALDKLAPNHWLYKSLRDRVEYAFLLRSDYDGLVDYYRERVAKRPNDVDSACRLIVTLGVLARYDQAKEVFEAAKKRAPKDVSVYKAGLELALAQNDNAQADELYEQLNLLTPNDLDLELAWGDVVLKNDALDAQTRKQRAVKIWTRVLDDPNASTSSLLLVADKLVDSNFRAEAEGVLKKLAASYPDDFEYCAGLARFYLRGDDRDAAFAALERFTNAHAKDAATWDKRANLLRSVGYAAEAVEAARRAVELAPGDFRRAIYLCDCEANADGCANDEDIARAEELAQTENEVEQTLAARLVYVRRMNVVDEYVASLNAELANAAPEKRAEIYWKKVSCALAFDDPNGAVDVAIEALETDAVSKALSAKIQEIVAKSQNPENTLRLLDVAAEKDGENIANYLRSRVRVCLELGLADDAIATGKKLLDYDSGLAENYRVYAEVLLECGRSDEAIAVLRRAAGLNNSDRMSELKLAGLLDEVGRSSEALDVLWQIFDRATRLEEKLTLIDAMSKTAAKLDRFDALKDRLQTSATTNDARRESAYCLARAYMSLKDYDSARTTLENAVAFMSARADDSGFWLHALSNLAELQNDIEGAIRFQEQLCELDSSSAERNRLLSLYRRTGNVERAREYLVRKILPTEPLWKRLETVDTLVSLDDYRLATAILDELDRGFDDNWEILARRLTIAGWTNSKELPALIQQVLTRQEQWNAKSSKSAAIEYDRNTVASTISGDAWRVGSDDAFAGRAVVKLTEPRDYRDLAAQTLVVVYRDKLTLKDKNARSMSTTLTSPQKPIPAYLNWGATVFEALAWQERLARANEEALPALESNADDYDALRTRYLREYYEYCLAASGCEKLDADVETLASAAQATASALCKHDRAWRVDAFAGVIKELETANDAKTLQTDAEFLLETLQASLDGDRLRSEANVWKLASYAANVMERQGLDAEANNARELVKLAGARDYSVLLSAGSDDEYVSFETFAANWKNVEAEVLRQTRNAADVERARELLGTALVTRLQAEIDEALKARPQSVAERVKRNGVVGQTLCEKVSFGHSVVNSFISLDRRTLFDVAETDALTKDEIVDLNARIYRLLDLAVESDARMTAAFIAKEGKRFDTGVNFTVAELLGYLERNTGTAFAMAAYLVDKTLYGRERPQSPIQSSRVLEYAFGATFSFDVVSASPEAQVRGEYAFTNLEALEKYIADAYARSDSVDLALYAKQIAETSRVLKTAARGDVEAESVDELKAKIEENIAALGDHALESSALLVASALLAGMEKDEQRELEAIERVKCVSFTEIKARELAVLGAFKNSNDSKILERKAQAVKTLSGSRLDEKEAAKFWGYLVDAGDDEEALKIRRRLETFVTSDSAVEAILDDILERSKEQPVADDVDVAFALRVFRAPSTSLRDSSRFAELRAKALATLNMAGKLNETLEKMETQIANAPGAYELALRLVDVKLGMGDVETAKTLLASMEERNPNDAAMLFDYASALARVGETDKAKGIVRAIYTKKLDEFFKRSSTPAFWTTADDVEFITSLSSENVAPYAFNAFMTLIDAIAESREPNSTLDTENVYESVFKLWNSSDADEDVRETLRSSGSRLLAQSGDSRYFPALCEFYVDSIALNANENGTYPAFQEIHRIVQWNDRTPKTLSILFLELADIDKDADALNALLTKVNAICAEHAKRPEENPVRHSAALTLQVEILLKLGRLDDALEALNAAEKFEAFCAKEFVSDPLTICLAFEYFLDDSERAKAEATLFKYYLKSYAVNTHSVYEPFHIAHIYPLGMRMNDLQTREKYTLLATKKLQEIFRLAAKADLSSDRRVGGSMETCETIAFYSKALIAAFDAVGRLDVAKQALRETRLSDRLDATGDDVLPAWTALFEELSLKLGE